MPPERNEAARAVLPAPARRAPKCYSPSRMAIKPTVTQARPDAEPEHAPPSPGEVRRLQGYTCDFCEHHFEGPPAGSGLFLWSRGDEYRFEEPPLCEECAMKISVGAVLKWESEEEEG
jgi:hypothetical protein